MNVVRGKSMAGAEDLHVVAMFDKFIRPADPLDGGGALALVEGFDDRAAKATGEHVILHGDEEGNAGGVAEEKGAIERFDEPCVDDADGEIFLES